MRIDIRPASATQLSNLKAVVNNVKTIDLSWTLPVNDPTYRAAQIWVNTVNDVDTATLVTVTAGNFYSYTAPDTVTRYFWIRTVNQWNRTDGPFTGPASAAGKLLTTGDIGVFDLATANIVNQLAVGKISGLGALATVSKVDAYTQVNNLGGLAYANAIYADDIGAGTLAAGVIYAGTLNASQIKAGTMSANFINGGTITGSTINIAGNFKVFTDGTSQLYTANLTRCAGSNGDAPGLAAFTANSWGAGAAIACNGNLIPSGGGALGSSGSPWTGVYSQSAVVVTSDQRAKRDIADCDLGLEFVTSLRPVSYRIAQNGMTVERGDELYGPWLPDQAPEYDAVYTPTEGVRRHYGFVAQEVKQALGDTDAALWVLSDKDDPDSRQALRYEELIAPMVKAMQQQQALIEQQAARIEALEEKIASL